MAVPGTEVENNISHTGNVKQPVALNNFIEPQYQIQEGKIDNISDTGQSSEEKEKLNDLSDNERLTQPADVDIDMETNAIHEENDYNSVSDTDDLSEPEDISLMPQKPYQCGRCDEAFESLNQLTIHVRTHTRESNPPVKKKFKKFLIHKEKGYTIVNDTGNLSKPDHQSNNILSDTERSSLNAVLQKQKVNDISDKEKMRMPELQTHPANVDTIMSDTTHLNEPEDQINNMLSDTERSSLNAVLQKQIVNDASVTENVGIPEAILNNFIGSNFALHTGVGESIAAGNNPPVPEKPFQCGRCEKAFKFSCQLEIHVRTHNGERPFACHLCGKAFAQNSNLKSHLKTHSDERPFKCNICGQAYLRKGDLMRHLVAHTGEKKYQCFQCNKAFAKSSNLTDHLRTHTGEKPYVCYLCNKAYGQTSQLNIHMRTHTGEKPYQCPHCEKAFPENSKLVRHLRIHTGEKPYLCIHCDKTFTNNSNLISHLRTHTGEKPYQCNQCGKSFRWTGNLQSHFKTHPECRPFDWYDTNNFIEPNVELQEGQSYSMSETGMSDPEADINHLLEPKVVLKEEQIDIIESGNDNSSEPEEQMEGYSIHYSESKRKNTDTDLLVVPEKKIKSDPEAQINNRSNSVHLSEMKEKTYNKLINGTLSDTSYLSEQKEQTDEIINDTNNLSVPEEQTNIISDNDHLSGPENKMNNDNDHLRMPEVQTNNMVYDNGHQSDHQSVSKEQTNNVNVTDHLSDSEAMVNKYLEEQINKILSSPVKL